MDNYTDLPKSRAEATALGAKKYFTGKPCSQGHIAPRYTVGACTMCQSAATSAWLSMRPEKKLEYAKRHSSRFPERNRARALKYARKKLPVPLYAAPERCECCTRLFTLIKDPSPRLDHDHITFRFRGWLCNGCNLSIGRLGDDIAGLERAIDYLRRAEKWQAPSESN